MSESVFGLSESIQSLLHRVVRVIEMNQLQASVSAGNCNSAIVRVDSALFAQKLFSSRGSVLHHIARRV